MVTASLLPQSESWHCSLGDSPSVVWYCSKPSATHWGNTACWETKYHSVQFWLHVYITIYIALYMVSMWWMHLLETITSKWSFKALWALTRKFHVLLTTTDKINFCFLVSINIWWLNSCLTFKTILPFIPDDNLC